MSTELTSVEIKARENSFATVMAQLVLKYGRDVLKEVEEENQTKSVA